MKPTTNESETTHQKNCILVNVINVSHDYVVGSDRSLTSRNVDINSYKDNFGDMLHSCLDICPSHEVGLVSLNKSYIAIYGAGLNDGDGKPCYNYKKKWSVNRTVQLKGQVLDFTGSLGFAYHIYLSGSGRGVCLKIIPNHDIVIEV